MVGDTAPARQDQSPTRSPGRGGRAGACLSSQWGRVWTAGGWGCRGPESRVAGGQLLAATPAQSRSPWLHTGHACPFHWPRSDPGAGLRRAVSCRCSKRGWAGETTSGQGQRGTGLHSTHTHTLPGHVGRAAALPYAHRPLTRSGPPVWGGAEGPTRRIVGSHSWRWGFPGSQDSV